MFITAETAITIQNTPEAIWDFASDPANWTASNPGEHFGLLPKHHIIVEAVGTHDEAGSLIGVARTSAREKRIKRSLLQAQKHFLVIGAELSAWRWSGL